MVGLRVAAVLAAEHGVIRTQSSQMVNTNPCVMHTELRQMVHLLTFGLSFVRSILAILVPFRIGVGLGIN